MGGQEAVVSLYRPRYPAAATDHNISSHTTTHNNMVATSLWSPGPLPAHFEHRQQHDEGSMFSFHLLLSLTTLGLPQYCDRLLTASTLLTDRLLHACECSPSPLSRRPLLWCAGLLRLMSDKLEEKMCYYNANMPSLWSELLRAIPSHRSMSQERHLPSLLSETSDFVCSFGSFLKDVQAFYASVEAELASLEAFLARRRRRRMVRYFTAAFFCFAILFFIAVMAGSRIPAQNQSLSHRARR